MLTLLKWPLIIFAAFVAAFGVLAIALSSSSDGSPAPVKLDLASIRQLSDAAEQDAGNMERHAQTMVTLAAARPDHAHWASDAELARASARSLRFLAESARAIDRDQAAFPAGASAIQIDRLQGDGLNLQGLGSTLIEHGNAMQKHGEVMRQEAGNDPTLVAAVTTLLQDVQKMKADGETAVDNGKALIEKARTTATSIGVKLD